MSLEIKVTLAPSFVTPTHGSSLPSSSASTSQAEQPSGKSRVKVFTLRATTSTLFTQSSACNLLDCNKTSCSCPETKPIIIQLSATMVPLPLKFSCAKNRNLKNAPQ